MKIELRREAFEELSDAVEWYDVFPALSGLALRGVVTMLGHVIRLTLEHCGTFDAKWATYIESARHQGLLRANARVFEEIARAGEEALATEDDEVRDETEGE